MVKRNRLKKRLVDVNRVFGGRIINEGNLDFETEMASIQKQPFKRASHLTRAMTSGHSFSDGNKRTAIVAVTSEMRDAGFKVDKKKLVRIMIKLSKIGEGNLKKIESNLRRCMKK